MVEETFVYIDLNGASHLVGRLWARARKNMESATFEYESGCTLQEIDYLLLVDDEARQGALRFAAREGGPFLREAGVKRISPLVELPRLPSAVEHVIEDKDTDEDLRLQLM